MVNVPMPFRVEAIIYIKKGNKYRFLLIRRSEQEGGFWQPVTGTVEMKESFEDCLYREIEEEIQITKDEIEFVTNNFYTFCWDKDGQSITEYVYAVELKKERRVKLSEEHIDQKWCSFEDALELLEKDNNKKSYKFFKSEFMRPS